MNLLKEFRSFALRGSVIDMAIGVTIGTAFVKMISALVNNVIMPPIGLFIGDVDFSHLRMVLKRADENGQGEVALGYGIFVQDMINFLIVSWVTFMIIRTVIRLRADPKAPPPTVNEEVTLLREIRDSLRVNKPQS